MRLSTRPVIEIMEARALLSGVVASSDFSFYLPILPTEAKPVITTPAEEATFAGGSVIVLNGYANHEGGERYPTSALNWQVDLQQGYLVTKVLEAQGNGGSFSVPSDASISAGDSYKITLSVTGLDGTTARFYRTIRPQVVQFQLSSNWSGAAPYLDDERMEFYSSSKTINLVANTTHQLRFNPGGDVDKLAYKFKGAKKTGGTGTLGRAGASPSEPVFKLSTKTRDLKVAARYTTRRVPVAPAAPSSQSGGVIVKYTYYGGTSTPSETTTAGDLEPYWKDHAVSGT